MMLRKETSSTQTMTDLRPILKKGGSVEKIQQSKKPGEKSEKKLNQEV
jgi:hypothetical protein